ncbi:hypothetical protein HDU76_012253 [Blyttiomyces sp. JEL0837]|nr:hypothetical protein HDU76_012253 [Blyttiomyces sp. JEL0837]
MLLMHMNDAGSAEPMPTGSSFAQSSSPTNATNNFPQLIMQTSSAQVFAGALPSGSTSYPIPPAKDSNNDITKQSISAMLITPSSTLSQSVFGLALPLGTACSPIPLLSQIPSDIPFILFLDATAQSLAACPISQKTDTLKTATSSLMLRLIVLSQETPSSLSTLDSSLSSSISNLPVLSIDPGAFAMVTTLSTSTVGFSPLTNATTWNNYQSGDDFITLQVSVPGVAATNNGGGQNGNNQPSIAGPTAPGPGGETNRLSITAIVLMTVAAAVLVVFLTVMIGWSRANRNRKLVDGSIGKDRLNGDGYNSRSSGDGLQSYSSRRQRTVSTTSTSTLISPASRGTSGYAMEPLTGKGKVYGAVRSTASSISSSPNSPPTHATSVQQTSRYRGESNLSLGGRTVVGSVGTEGELWDHQIGMPVPPVPVLQVPTAYRGISQNHQQQLSQPYPPSSRNGSPLPPIGNSNSVHGSPAVSVDGSIGSRGTEKATVVRIGQGSLRADWGDDDDDVIRGKDNNEWDLNGDAGESDSQKRSTLVESSTGKSVDDDSAGVLKREFTWTFQPTVW